MSKNQIWSCVVVIIFLFASCNEDSQEMDPSPPPVPLTLSMTLAQMNPVSGPSVGGTKVVLTGQGFAQGVQVLFGDQPANQIEWISSSEIHVLAPPLPGKQGPVLVKVIDPQSKTSSSEQKFSYFTTDVRFTSSQEILGDQKPQSMIPLCIQDRIENKLAVVTAKEQKIGFFTWDSKGSTLKAIDPLSSKTQATLLVTGDFNGDGQEDLVLGDPSGSIFVMFQDGKGGFLSPHTFSMPKDIKWMNVADVNQDGALDIVTISGSQVTTLINNQRGGFSISLGTYIGQTPQSFALGDIDYDQKIDLLVVANQKLYIALGNGDGTFQIPYPRTLSDIPQTIALADINRDGTLDWLVSTTDTAGKNNKFLLFLSQEDKTQKLTSFDVASPINSIIMGDINGDGFLDVMTSGTHGQSILVFMGTDKGTLELTRNISTKVDSQKLVIADMNGDQKPDLVLLSTDVYSPAITILFNDSQ